MPVRPEDLIVSPTMREHFLRLGTIISKPKGAILFHHGDIVTGAFLIQSGRVQLTLEGVNPAFPARILRAGCVVGLPASVAGSPYSLTAQVIEDAELAFVTRVALIDCLRDNPQLCFEVMDMLSAEISGTRSALKHTSALRPRKP